MVPGNWSQNANVAWGFQGEHWWQALQDSEGSVARQRNQKRPRENSCCHVQAAFASITWKPFLHELPFHNSRSARAAHNIKPTGRELQPGAEYHAKQQSCCKRRSQILTGMRVGNHHSNPVASTHKIINAKHLSAFRAPPPVRTSMIARPGAEPQPTCTLLTVISTFVLSRYASSLFDCERWARAASRSSGDLGSPDAEIHKSGPASRAVATFDRPKCRQFTNHAQRAELSHPHNSDYGGTPLTRTTPEIRRKLAQATCRG